MTIQTDKTTAASACTLPNADLRDVRLVELHPQQPVKDYIEAMALAKEEAEHQLGDCMLMSWYDRDRDVESPLHASESDNPSATPGYILYGINHGATLQIDVEDGRFVFFFTPVEF